MSVEMLDRSAVQALFAEMVRVGKVAEVSTDGRVRCTFADRDNVSSHPLPVLHRRRGDQDMPAVGAQAICLMLPPDLVDGFCLGVFYDASNAPPEPGDAGVRVLAGTDIRIGSENATHPVPYGDIVLLLLQGIFDLLRTAVIPTGVGPSPMSADATAQNSYGVGGISAVLTLMENSEDGLAGLNSETVAVD